MSSCCWGFLQRSQNRKREDITLNVGGVHYTMLPSTILQYRSSVLQLAVKEAQITGEAFVNKDGTHFSKVADFMRDGPKKFRVPTDIAEFEELRHLACCLELDELLACLDQATTSSARTKMKSSQMPMKHVGASLPLTEKWRMQRLREANVLYTGPEHRFDSITRVLAAILHVPTCLVSLVADDHQWFKSACGFHLDRTPRSASFCPYTLVPEHPCDARMMVVEDTHQDSCFASSPLVTGSPHIRFYAGCPLIGWDGVRYGALCVIDQSPRVLSATESQLLVNFAQLVVQEIEREQLYGSPVGTEDEGKPVEKPQVGPSGFKPLAHGFNFECGFLRRWRMRQALSEATILVWSLDNTPENSRILYGNEAFSQMAGLRVQTELHFPHGSIESADGKTRGNKLVDLVDLHDPRFQLGPLQASATLRISGGKKCVTCRFNPAGFPLDANAAVVQSRPLWISQPGECGLEGHFYFVTMVVKEEEINLHDSL
jgi:hypothetical protein